MKKTKEENEDNRTMFLGQLGGGLIAYFSNVYILLLSYGFGITLILWVTSG